MTDGVGGQHFHLEKWQVEEIASTASRKAINETFRLLGVDTADQASLNEFRADLVHARSMRRMSDRATTVAWTVCITAIVGGLIAAVAGWFKN